MQESNQRIKQANNHNNKNTHTKTLGTSSNSREKKRITKGRHRRKDPTKLDAFLCIESHVSTAEEEQKITPTTWYSTPTMPIKTKNVSTHWKCNLAFRNSLKKKYNKRKRNRYVRRADCQLRLSRSTGSDAAEWRKKVKPIRANLVISDEFLITFEWCLDHAEVIIEKQIPPIVRAQFAPSALQIEVDRGDDDDDASNETDTTLVSKTTCLLLTSWWW